MRMRFGHAVDSASDAGAGPARERYASRGLALGRGAPPVDVRGDRPRSHWTYAAGRCGELVGRLNRGHGLPLRLACVYDPAHQRAHGDACCEIGAVERSAVLDALAGAET